MTTVGPLPGHYGSMATDVNEAGTVVGSSDDLLGYHWSAGVIKALPPLDSGTWSQAYGVNDLGDVVGSAGANDFLLHAVVWRPEFNRDGWEPPPPRPA